MVPGRDAEAEARSAASAFVVGAALRYGRNNYIFAEAEAALRSTASASWFQLENLCGVT